MIYFKACQKCGGDQILERAQDCTSMSCLACGFTAYMRVEDDAPRSIGVASGGIGYAPVGALMAQTRAAAFR